MAAVPTFNQYLATLGRLSAHIDPTASTPDAEYIRDAAHDLASLGAADADSLARWIRIHPRAVPVLGLVVGLSQERLKNVLRNEFDTSGWVTLAREHPADLIGWLDVEFDLLRMLAVQQARDYEFADVLIARAGSRVVAAQAGKSGRRVEDEIEAVAQGLNLPYETRTRFTGRSGETAPCDLVVPSSDDAQIVVAAKGFDSTGSKLTDAVREIQEMASVRKSAQHVIAVIDGIGWKSRASDLRKIHGLWASGDIDGMYTLATLDQFRDDLEEAARLRRII